VPAKKGLGLDDAQDVPPRRGDGRECDQHDSVEPRHARSGNRALQDGELVAEHGVLSEQRSARAKGVRQGGDQHEDGFEHGRSRVRRRLEFSSIPEVARTGRAAGSTLKRRADPVFVDFVDPRSSDAGRAEVVGRLLPELTRRPRHHPPGELPVRMDRHGLCAQVRRLHRLTEQQPSARERRDEHECRGIGRAEAPNPLELPAHIVEVTREQVRRSGQVGGQRVVRVARRRAARPASWSRPTVEGIGHPVSQELRADSGRHGDIGSGTLGSARSRR
jgi:hypothetical protein